MVIPENVLDFAEGISETLLFFLYSFCDAVIVEQRLLLVYLSLLWCKWAIEEDAVLVASLGV